MARSAARLPAGSRITDYVSLGVVAKTFPINTVRAIVSAMGRGSIRERDLPAHVVMYYITSSPWHFTCSPPRVKCCDVCWKASNG